MDPQEAYKKLQEVYREQKWDEVLEILEALIDWIQRGGFTEGLEPIKPAHSPGVPLRVGARLVAYNELLYRRMKGKLG